MTNEGRRDKESCAGDHRKRTETPLVAHNCGDTVTLARRWLARQSADLKSVPVVVPHLAARSGSWRFARSSDDLFATAATFAVVCRTLARSPFPGPTLASNIPRTSLCILTSPPAIATGPMRATRLRQVRTTMRNLRDQDLL